MEIAAVACRLAANLEHAELALIETACDLRWPLRDEALRCAVRRLPVRLRPTSGCPARVRLALIAADRKHPSMMLNGTYLPGRGPPPLCCGRRRSATYWDCLSSALAVTTENKGERGGGGEGC